MDRDSPYPPFNKAIMIIPTQRTGVRVNGHSNQTHCQNGHEFNEDNTYISPKSRKRSCRICCAARTKEKRRTDPSFVIRATENMRIWRAANPERNRKSWVENRKRKKLWLDEQKLSCLKCGESDGNCLDFHHRDPAQKSLTLSIAIAHASLERIQEELTKCDVLCANCHRKLHAAERAAKKNKEQI